MAPYLLQTRWFDPIQPYTRESREQNSNGRYNGTTVGHHELPFR